MYLLRQKSGYTRKSVIFMNQFSIVENRIIVINVYSYNHSNLAFNGQVMNWRMLNINRTNRTLFISLSSTAMLGNNHIYINQLFSYKRPFLNSSAFACVLCGSEWGESEVSYMEHLRNHDILDDLICF